MECFSDSRIVKVYFLFITFKTIDQPWNGKATLKKKKNIKRKSDRLRTSGYSSRFIHLTLTSVKGLPGISRNTKTRLFKARLGLTAHRARFCLVPIFRPWIFYDSRERACTAILLSLYFLWATCVVLKPCEYDKITVMNLFLQIFFPNRVFKFWKRRGWIDAARKFLSLTKTDLYYLLNLATLNDTKFEIRGGVVFKVLTGSFNMSNNEIIWSLRPTFGKSLQLIHVKNQFFNTSCSGTWDCVRYFNKFYDTKIKPCQSYEKKKKLIWASRGAFNHLYVLQKNHSIECTKFMKL